MSENRERAMVLAANEHVMAVLEFIHWNIPSQFALGVADVIPQMARLLWTDKQEPLIPIRLELTKSCECSHLSPASKECDPVKECADGGFVEAAVSR